MWYVNGVDKACYWVYYAVSCKHTFDGVVVAVSDEQGPVDVSRALVFHSIIFRGGGVRGGLPGGTSGGLCARSMRGAAGGLTGGARGHHAWLSGRHRGRDRGLSGGRGGLAGGLRGGASAARGALAGETLLDEDVGVGEGAVEAPGGVRAHQGRVPRAIVGQKTTGDPTQKE